MPTLTTIEGIGSVACKRLKAAGIGSTLTLLRAGATRAGRNAIAEATGLDADRILKFVNHADLMRVRGVGGEYAELLEAAGVDSVPELRHRNAANLATAMAEVNTARKLVRMVPGAGRVADWIGQAKALDRVVTH